MLLYYVTEEQVAAQGETGPRDIQMIIPLHQLHIPHIQDLEQYLSPSTTNTTHKDARFTRLHTTFQTVVIGGLIIFRGLHFRRFDVLIPCEREHRGEGR